MGEGNGTPLQDSCVENPMDGQSPGREAALAWASLAQRFPASSGLARAGACIDLFSQCFQSFDKNNATEF